ncbi:GNAT family N-acetyltransferase [Aerosakkonema funiforme]|uniref:GNAT family N-acetyltransferase n=1 Tax=Aerosakkonema funiforme FACHB-1375 TaxID=2949571 RepID=A0A926ZH38_9CYAN|nr:GNAT family N-acetyltransferase [Aerosakkonema funiforme]MBD2181762.1 GNAT family N-acetyltransferase [Aerosakkonema funiforme FACHB-1375]
MKIHRIAYEERSHFQPGIVAIEQAAIYPLGDDFFQIDHGKDYFAFFDRLGEVNYYVAVDVSDRSVAGVGAGVLRQVPYCQGEEVRPAWYLCDLKVHPDYQRQHLSLRLLRHALDGNIFRCDRGYTISMNKGDRTPNRLVSVLERFSPVKFSRTATLLIYSLDAENMRRYSSLLVEHRGNISYLSLRGIKDLKLQSTAEYLPLLHVQWGAIASTGISQPVPGYVHMFCVPENDDLAQALVTEGIFPTATASVVSHGMDKCDWRFILTSDI